MSNTFQNYSDDQLLDYLENNCPEGKLFDAVDELATRMGFYQTIVTEMANQGGRTLEEFLHYFEGIEEVEEEENDLESMSLSELQQLHDRLVAERNLETQRQELIKKIKELTKD